MSFGQKSQYIEMRAKEKSEDTFRHTISDKLMDMINKNNFIADKIHKINEKNYIIREDEEFVTKYCTDIKSSFDNVTQLLKEFESLINNKYIYDPDLKDKYTALLQHFTKNLRKESENFANTMKMYDSIRDNLIKKMNDLSDEHESKGLLSKKNNTDISEDQLFKVKDGEIKHIGDVATYRKQKFENIYKSSLMVQEMTSSIHSLTAQHEDKLLTIDDNIEKVQQDSKETFNTLIKTSKTDKKFTQNNCYLLLVIVLLIFSLIFFLIQWKR